MLGQVGDQFYNVLVFSSTFKLNICMVIVIVGCSIWYDMRLLSLF